MIHTHDCIVALLCAAALSPAACSSRAERPPVTTAATAPGAAARGSDGPPGTTAGDWPGWQKDLRGTRYNADEHVITPATVAGLKLKWSFVFPDVEDRAHGSQPAVVGHTLYVGWGDGKIYALDARTGETLWVSAASASADANAWGAAVYTGPAVADGKVIFGDGRGNLYALDAGTGRPLWSVWLGEHKTSTISSSPLVFDGNIYVGIANGEEAAATEAAYPCCTARGQFVSVSLATGTVRWRRYTMPPAERAGSWPDGVARYAPAGAGVWSSPAIDPVSRTVFYGTGNSFTGTSGPGEDNDSVFALDADTGAVRWKQQMNHPDVWTVGCIRPFERHLPVEHCEGIPDGTNNDWDFGSSPNVFTVNGRTLVGIGQKSGYYHAFDATTGQIVWQRQMSVAQNNGGSMGILWGSAYDGRRVYVATWLGKPGTLFGLNPANGEILWRTPNPADGCTTGGAAAHGDACHLGHMSAVTATPGLVYEGSADGKMRIYGAEDGKVLWQYDTVREFTGVNQATGPGGAIAGHGGAVVAHGMLYVHSGYYSWFGMTGRVLLAFGL
ncbi:MAG TPA: PQQ-binding-like beta-propeller repeat protein [Kofleriaceae bacterium]|nr:PQQ-binding-like beta-propeller repeat protein [Kofleriaceae bacterium]